MTMRTFHLLLLRLKVLEKPIDIPLISFQIPQELFGPLIGEEPIEVVSPPRKKGVEVDLSGLLLLWNVLLRWVLFFFHQ